VGKCRMSVQIARLITLERQNGFGRILRGRRTQPLEARVERRNGAAVLNGERPWVETRLSPERPEV